METQTTRKMNPLVTLQVLWAAMLATQAIFVLISQTATTSPVSTAGETSAAVALEPAVGSLPVSLFVLLAFVSLALAVFLPKLLVKAKVLQLRPEAGQTPLEQLIPIAVTAKIIRWAMLESITVYGLILSLVNGNPYYIYPFAAVSLIGFAMTFPNEKAIRTALGVN